jgi:hypothetical protein
LLVSYTDRELLQIYESGLAIDRQLLRICESGFAIGTNRELLQIYESGFAIGTDRELLRICESGGVDPVFISGKLTTLLHLTSSVPNNISSASFTLIHLNNL